MPLVVQTVLGPIQPNLLGRTLTHEHFAINLEQFLVPAPDEIKPFLHKNISLDNLGLIRQYPYSCPYNVKFDDEEAREAIKKDLKLFKQFGGNSIVENTCHGLTRDLAFMTEVSKSTGVHVIAGTGHYTHNLQTPETLKLGVEQMTDLYAKEIIAGVEVNNGKNTVKCGFIGEVGCGYPLHEFEKHSILATGEIQEVLGCGVSFHPGFVPEAPFEIVRIYLEAGGKANKCVMSHLDTKYFIMLY